MNNNFTVLLGSVATITSSKRIFLSDYVSNGIPFFRSKEIIEKSLKQNVSTELFITKERFDEIRKQFGAPLVGEILISAVGERAGIPYVVKKSDGDFYFKDGNLIWIKGFNVDLSSDYLCYYFKSNIGRQQLESSMIGSAQKALTIIGLKQIEIPLPILKDQESIVEVLNSLDDKIDLFHQQNKTLEALAETMFRQRLSSSYDNWKPQPFAEFIQDTFGGEWGKDLPTDDFNVCTSCIRGTDIADLQTGLPERTPVRYVKDKKLASILPKDGDIIMEISGGTDDQSTGRTMCVDKVNRSLFPHPLVFSNFCRLIRPKAEKYGYFLDAYLRYIYNQDEFFNMENGTSGIKNLDYKYLLFKQEYNLPVHDYELSDYHDQVKDIHEKIGKNKLQMSKLQQTRDTLLPKLMSGAVRVIT